MVLISLEEVASHTYVYQNYKLYKVYSIISADNDVVDVLKKKIGDT